MSSIVSDAEQPYSDIGTTVKRPRRGRPPLGASAHHNQSQVSLT